MLRSEAQIAGVLREYELLDGARKQVGSAAGQKWVNARPNQWFIEPYRRLGAAAV
jgi:hypothetical protein